MNDNKPTANIQDLIHHVYVEMNTNDDGEKARSVTKAEAKRMVEATLQGIVQLATDKQKLTLREFGRFELRMRKARINSKPIQGKPTTIPAREILHFTPSTLLTKEVDYV